jgi:hypothetical protein
VLAAEHLLDLAGLHFLIEQFERVGEVGVDRLAGFDPFLQNVQVVALAQQRPQQVAILLEAPAALQDFLRFSLIFPEIGSRRPRFEARQLLFGAGSFKDSSGGRQRVG